MKRILILLCLPLLFTTCKKEDEAPNNNGNNSTQTYVPDDNFEASLEANGMGNGIANDDYVTTANINTVTQLDVSNQNISNLTGIEDFTALTEFGCWNNQLTSLDVSNNNALTHLECSSNQLTSLDVSGATALTALDCSNNQLTTLDVSQNTALTFLWCSGNNLTSLDVRNGNNTNMSGFGCTGNPNLTCISVDDAVWSTANWTNIDGQHYFSNNCSGTAIGDFHQGGVIFYLDGNGGGLICDIEDLSSSAGWGCQGNDIPGAEGIAIGTGMQNTIDIEAGCITANTAADKCANSTAQGYSDWFLPSQDELNEIFLNRLTINATATSNGGVDFMTSYYWSSSEDGNQFALLQIFDSGIQSNTFKSYAFNVRAIRAF